MKKILPLLISVSIAIACIVIGFIHGIPLNSIQRKTINILLIICVISATYCFIAGELSRNNSQMDKLWSVLPIAYVWIIAAMGEFRWRLIIIAIIVTLWGARLTYNFAKKRRIFHQILEWRGRLSLDLPPQAKRVPK